MNSLKPIYEFTDYRRYLQEYYAWAKANKRGFSHRAFLKKAGMSGPNYLKRVMEGEHNLTDNSIPKFTQAMDLDEKQANYFKHLVYFNQAKTLDEKDRYFAELMELKTPVEDTRRVLEKDQYDYYLHWYNVAIREMLAFFPFADNPAEMGKQLNPSVPTKKVKLALDLLKRLEMIELKEDGTWRAAADFVKSNPDIDSLLLPKFHQAMAKLAEEAITRFPKEERHFSSVTVSLSPPTYHKIIEIIRTARKQALEAVAQDPGPSRVYHLNLQLFPLTHIKSKKKLGPHE
jgi:uncharacterized protein (TIGR02147 family)